jgi:phosphoserine phosphatase RsbU/P
VGQLPEDQKLTEHAGALDATGDLFWAIFNTAPVGMFIVQDGRFQLVNPQFQRDTGYAGADLIGMDSLGLVLPEDRDLVRKAAVALLKTQRHTPYEYRIANRKREVRWILGTLTSIQYRQRRAAVGYYMDITKRKEAEQAIETVNRRMTADLEAAARLQKALLPAAFAGEQLGIKLTWALEPCEELAGDTLNHVLLDHEHLALYILDVSGHGLVAALLSVTLHRALSPLSRPSSLTKRSGEQVARRPISPAKLAAELNERFLMDPALPQYFTLLYGVLNVRTLRFQYVCAGHPGPVYVSPDGPVTLVQTAGFPIGLLPQARYEEHRLDLEPGGRLYLYSDGITETMDRQGREFGQQRLREIVAGHRHLPLENSVALLIQDVKRWNASAQQTDDLSILAVEVAREGRPGPRAGSRRGGVKTGSKNSPRSRATRR